MKQALGGRRGREGDLGLGHHGYTDKILRDMPPPLQWHTNAWLHDHSDLTHSLYRCLLTTWTDPEQCPSPVLLNSLRTQALRLQTRCVEDVLCKMALCSHAMVRQSPLVTLRQMKS